MEYILNLEQFKIASATWKNVKDVCLKNKKSQWHTINGLHSQSKIDHELLKELKSFDGQFPKLYWLTKSHKRNAPLWQVLPMPISPYHKIVKKITKWLSVIPESKTIAQPIKLLRTWCISHLIRINFWYNLVCHPYTPIILWKI